MKFTILTDQSTNISEALLNYGLIIINDEKYKKGRITYALDIAFNQSDALIYLTSKDNLPLVKEIINKELKIHDKIAYLVDASSASIGKNNLALKVLTSQDPVMAINKYKASNEELVSQDYVLVKQIIKC